MNRQGELLPGVGRGGGDGGAEGSSVIGDGGRAVIPLVPDSDGTHVCIFESSQLEGLYGAGVLTVFYLDWQRQGAKKVANRVFI